VSRLVERGIGRNHHDVENQVLDTHTSRERGKRKKRNRDKESNCTKNLNEKKDFS
jgi:hypothetical protein